jgi:hypothetical protein
MQLPNLSRLSLRNSEAATDGIFKNGTDPPPHPDPPASGEELLESIREKVRPLVYTDQMLRDLFNDDLALHALDKSEDHYSHNEIIPFGGTYIPGVVQASYDYKILSETKFEVKVHTTLQNSIGGRPVGTTTVEFEYEDTLYDELKRTLDFLKDLETLSKSKATLDRKNNKILATLKKHLDPPPRNRQRNETPKDYGQYLLTLCFVQFARPLQYIYNGFREGEDVPITREIYIDKVNKITSNNPDEANEMGAMLDELWPDGDQFVPPLDFYVLGQLNGMALSTKDYPFDMLAPKGRKGKSRKVFFKETFIPRSFWLLFVLHAIEKCLVESLYSLLHFPPPPAEEPRGGPAYELWMDEANKLESGSDSQEAGRE